MARKPKPWFRKQTGEWVVIIDGEWHRLGPDKDDAETKFHELMAQPSKRVPSSTVKAVVDLFLDWTKKHRAEETYLWYRKHLQSLLDHLKPALLRVDQLKAHHIDSWIDDHGWGESYSRGAMTAITRCLNWAAKKDHIERNPISGKLDKPVSPKREVVISQKEYDKLLPHLSGALRDLVETAWTTGCRPREVLGVEAHHVDLKNGRWVFEVENSKREECKRVVYLSDAALKITKRLMAKHPTGPLFRLECGTPWNRHDVSQHFQRLKKKIGIHYRLYDFRHSFITNGMKNGVDPVTMANLVGHVNLKMIHEVYNHVSQDTKFMRQAAKKVTAG